MRRARIIVGLVAAAFVIACLSISHRDGTHPVQAAFAATLQADDQTITLQLPGDPITLDPQRSESEQDVAVEHLLFRGLFTFDADANPVPALAAEIPTRENGGVSGDGLTYTIPIQSGQTFSDGNPLTARDIVYSIQRLLDPATASPYADFYYDISGAQAFNTALGTGDQPRTPTPEELQALRSAVGVAALDDQTVQFTLTRPSGSFLARLALWSAVPVEQAAIERYGTHWTDAGNLVGNGPFLLADRVPNSQLTLVANPSYTLAPAPYLQRIVLRVIGDPVQAFAAYQAGQLDQVNVPPSMASEIASDPAYAGQLRRAVRQETRGWQFNTTQPPFNDPRVRLALAKAVNRDELIQSVYGGVGSAGATWLPPGLPGYDAANESIQAFDPAAARKLLAAAGYPNGQGFPDVKLLLTDNSLNKILFEFLHRQITDSLNVTIEADFVDSKTRTRRFDSQQYQLTYGGWVGDYPNADDWLPALFTTGAGENHYGFADPDFDSAVAAASAEPDPHAQAPLWSAAEKILLQSAAVAPLDHGEFVQLWRPWVQGLQPSSTDSGWIGNALFEQVYIAR